MVSTDNDLLSVYLPTDCVASEKNVTQDVEIVNGYREWGMILSPLYL